jgi:hypothetical protein
MYQELEKEAKLGTQQGPPCPLRIGKKETLIHEEAWKTPLKSASNMALHEIGALQNMLARTSV